MFRSWLKLVDCCARCGLDYRFAAPDDGPAFFSLCFVAFPLVFLLVWLEVAVAPPIWVHLFISFPLLIIGCVLPLRPIKGWLVASQFVNRAREAGTEALWKKLDGPSAAPRMNPNRPPPEPATDRREGLSAGKGEATSPE